MKFSTLRHLLSRLLEHFEGAWYRRTYGRHADHSVAIAALEARRGTGD